MRILILRPEPGAAETAARALALGLDPVIAPLFAVRPLAWEPPAPERLDAVLLTSANAARHGGPALARFAALPCHAVGDATAAAARAAGFADVRAGAGDGAALAAAAAQAGARRVLHLHGRDHKPLSGPALAVESRIVYASEAASALPQAARQALKDGALALLHSPRSAALFAALIPARGGVRIAAISAATAAAAGGGWALVAVAKAPRDDALLELAAKLCNIAGTQEAGAGQEAGAEQANGL